MHIFFLPSVVQSRSSSGGWKGESLNYFFGANGTSDFRCFGKSKFKRYFSQEQSFKFVFLCTWQRTEKQQAMLANRTLILYFYCSNTPNSDYHSSNQDRECLSGHRRAQPAKTKTRQTECADPDTVSPGSFSQDMKELRFSKLQRFSALWWN